MTQRKRHSRRKPSPFEKPAVVPEPVPLEPAAIEAVLGPLMEALAENEALTSNLQDAEAKRLLDWARTQAEALVREALRIVRPEQREIFLEEGMGGLRRRLRGVNQQMEDAYNNGQPAAERLEKLLWEPGG